jgi:hypothetical protein
MYGPSPEFRAVNVLPLPQYHCAGLYKELAAQTASSILLQLYGVEGCLRLESL